MTITPRPAKTIAQSRFTLSHLMGAPDANTLGNAHGGVIMKLVDEAGGGRAQLDAVEQISRGDAAFDQFGFLALDLAEFLDDVGTEFLVDAHALQLGLADLGPGLGDGGDQLPAFALDARALALQRR